MRIQRLLLASFFALAALGCGSEGEGDIQLATVFPDIGYTGASQTVLISGNKTEWENGSSVSFGDGVVVDSAMVIGPSSILANIRVENGAAVGGRQVTVDEDVLQNGFEVAESLAVSATIGTSAQGSIVTVTVDSQNPQMVFDSTQTGDGLFTPISYPNFNIEVSGVGAVGQVSSVSPRQAVITLLVDVDAEVGPRDLTVVNGGAEAEMPPVTLTLASFVNISARSAESFTGSDITGTQEAPFASRLFEINPGGEDVTLLNLAAGSLDENASPQLILLGSDGTFQQFLDSGSALTFTDLEPRYLIYFDRSSLSGQQYTIAVDSENLGPLTAEPSPEANEDETEALAAAIPSIFSGNLSSETDQDWYEFSIGGGESFTITAFTEPGDDFADPVITVYEDSDLENPIAEVDFDFHESWTSETPLGNGTYYIVISQSAFFDYDPTQTAYNLVITGVLEE